MSRKSLSSVCTKCQSRLIFSATRRPFSTIRSRQQENQEPNTAEQIFQDALGPSSRAASNPTATTTPRRRGKFMSEGLESLAVNARAESSTRPEAGVSPDEPYHLNVYAHKHNMHITFTEPTRNPILSLSAGNIGLKKAQRGTYDAAYQLTTYTFRKLAEKQWRTGGKGATTNKMLTLNEDEVQHRGIEIVFRGYGPGREAFQKALLGTEGRMLKPMIKKLTDSTRLKFGGARSPQVRRLG